MFYWGLVLFGASAALAAPVPVKPLRALERGWTELNLRVDIRNLTGSNDLGRIPEAELIRKMEDVNSIWAQCSVKFTPRYVSNVSAEKLKVPYQPQSQEDLGKIAVALNPDGYPALPVTVAGPWTFLDPGSGLYLSGLGWVFLNAKGLDRIGAMISATKIFDPTGVPILAHEIAHALSLPHSSIRDNLMGGAGTNDLTSEQCVQARRFVELALHEFVIGLEPEKVEEKLLTKRD